MNGAKLSRQHLTVLETMRNLFERDDEIDARDRKETATVYRETQSVLSAEQTKVMDDVVGRLNNLSGRPLRRLLSPDHNVKMGLIYSDDARGGIIIGKTVMDVECEAAAANETNMDDRDHVRVSASEGKSIEKHFKSATDGGKHKTHAHFVSVSGWKRERERRGRGEGKMFARSNS